VTRNREVHVCAYSDGNRWVVRRGRRTLSRHRTQATAVKAAQRTAKQHQADLVTHDRGGRIRSKDSYGNETARRDREH
jgi:hypothetical protein